jgi:hypothetical protein
MPEHVHLLVSEPERSTLAVAIQMLKQIVAQKLGPDVKPQKNVLPMNPVVFYSPKLNTCLFINRTIIGAKDISHDKVYAYLEDLLTGHTVQSTSFDLTVPEDKQASGDFEDNVLQIYGVPSGEK